MNKIQAISSALEKATNKHHIDAAFNEFLTLLENSPEGFSHQCQNLILLFRDKIYQYVFSKGEILEKFYLCLYAIIDAATPTDKRFEPFIHIATNNLFSKGISDEENLMILELGAIAKMLSGNKNEAIKDYIKNISFIDMHIPSAQKAANFILKSFVLLQIPFEIFIEAMQEVLEPENFAKLDAKRRRSAFNWQLHVFWNVKHFFNHRDWLKLYPLWEKIFYQTLQDPEPKKIDEALYEQFFIYHMCGNSFTCVQDWKDFNQKISQKASNVYKKFAQSFGLPKPNSHLKTKKIIGFLRDRFVENSPYKVEYSFLKALNENETFKQNYEIKMYLMGFLEKSDDDAHIKESYEALGIKIIDVIAAFNQDGYYNSHLSKALSIREALLKDGVDILISPNNGYGISDFILASRSAPKQIFWSHGNFVYDIPEIDLRITHICSQAGALRYENYDFMGVSVGMESKFYNPLIPPDIIIQERLKYPKEKIILGVIGRLTKIDSLPYLKSIINIMQKFPNTIFLACGTGNIHEIKQKITSIDAGILERFFFPGYVNSSIYGHIIDFWPDSFPMEQGESKVEFNAKGGIILTLSKENQKEREKRIQDWIQKNLKEIQEECQKCDINLETLKKIWIEDISCIAFEEEEYIKKASDILSLSKDQKQKLSNQRLILRKIYDAVRKNKGIKSFLEVIENA